MSGFLALHGELADPAAVGVEGEPLSYAALTSAAQGLAAELEEHAPGDVLLLCGDRYWFAVALLAAWQAGRRVTLPPHRGSAALTELRARHLVLHDGAEEVGIDVRGAAPGDAEPLRPIEAEREVLVLYTSGTSGDVQPWAKRARQVLGEAQVLARQLAIAPRELVFPTVASQHIYGLLFGLLMPLAAGASFSRGTPLHAQTIFANAERLGARWVVSVPAHLEVLSGLLESRPPSAWSVHGVISSAAPLPLETARRLRRQGLEVIDVLGSTETGGLGLRRTGVEMLWTPLEGVEVQADGAERLVVRSPFLADPRAAHVASDRGWVEADGRFRHLGRNDDVVKVGGKRVALGEVEAQARAVAGVVDVAALRHEVGGLRGDEIWLVAVAPGLSSLELRTALRGRLDAVFVPRRIRLVTALPHDENGKLSRARLRAAFEAPATEPALSAVTFDEQRARAEALLSTGWERFEGHFPGDPLLPAVSQLVDLVLPLVRLAWPELELMTRANRLKFLQPVRPNERVTVALERNLTKVTFELRGGEQVLARGTLRFQGAEAPEHLDV